MNARADYILRNPALSVGLTLLLLLALEPRAAATSEDPSPHSDATLVSETAGIAPGTPFTVALRLTIEPGWHSYWKNPGDSGEPTSLEWRLPDGWEVDSLQWPYPERIPFGSLVTYGYHDEVHLLTTLTPPDTLRPGTTIALDAKAEWLVCKKLCLPAQSELSLSLPVIGSVPTRSDDAPRIASARTRTPKAVDTWAVDATHSRGSYSLALTPPAGTHPDLEGAYFFPAEKPVLDHTAPQPIAQTGGRYVLALQRSEYAGEPAERLEGVLVAPEGQTWDAEGEVRAMRVDVPVSTAIPDRASASAGADGSVLSLPWALLFAAVGGLLLNLMPCVFPVLSVKILGFAQEADGNWRSLRRHGLLFGAGVLVSMWVLAGALVTLRAAGSQIGWGFQLQSPVFIALLTMLFFGIGLNLLGVFEVGIGVMNWGGRLQQSTPTGGGVGAFLTGVLATVVATPCTAPFMGAALGAALALSPIGAFLIFTALGAGMATPYVLLSITPAFLEHLPEPGAWMQTLKQGFAFPMFATAIWLVWVYGQQTSITGVGVLLAALLLLGVAAWILHRWPDAQRSTRERLVSRGLVFTIVVGALAVAVVGAGQATTETTARSAAEPERTDGRWQPFSAERIETLRSRDRPVFVDFTAAWCLTCQVNKRRVLTAKTVQAAFAEKNVGLVRADWTNRDPEITTALESHGRSGVPTYVLYPGDESGPQLLPAVLTEDIVLRALEQVPSS